MADERTKIPVDKIVDPFIAMRSETNDGDIDELMSSMRDVGLVQPITVRPIGDKYEVIAGHRRTTAARLLGWALIDAVVVQVDDDMAFAMRIAENLSRKDVDPVDEACFVGEIMSRHKKTVSEVAAILKRSEAWVNDRIEIFSMPDYLQGFLKHKRIPLGAALWLNRIENERTKSYYSHFGAQNGVSVAGAKYWYELLAARNFAFNPTQEQITEPETGTQRVRAAVQCEICGQKVFLEEAANIWVHPDCVPKDKGLAG